MAVVEVFVDIELVIVDDVEVSVDVELVIVVDVVDVIVVWLDYGLTHLTKLGTNSV